LPDPPPKRKGNEFMKRKMKLTNEEKRIFEIAKKGEANEFVRQLLKEA
jgi:hypothetical protein